MSDSRSETDNRVLGAVARLWRYPVKSMLGEEYDFLDFDTRGVVGDRHFAVRDGNGKVGSGKTTRRFRQIDGLLQLQATYQDMVPAIRLPDGRIMRGDHPDIHSTLSRVLQQPVSLVRESNTSHLDAGPVHLLTTATLAWLRQISPDMCADERRFRPNLVIATPGAEPVEQNWLGKVLTLGGTARLRVFSATERCRMVGLAQAELPYDERILDCITERADLKFGVYAEVLQPGRIARGDTVTLIAST